MTSAFGSGGDRTRTPGGTWEGPAGGRQLGGLTLSTYAQATAQRERILDEAAIRKHGARTNGDLAAVWIRLREHAIHFGVPIVEGDLDATNRIFEWDQLIMHDDRTRSLWLRGYPHELARVCSLDPDESIGRAAVGFIEGQSAFVWNAFVPLHLRRPGVTDDVCAYARRLLLVRTAPLRPANDARLSSVPPPRSGEREVRPAAPSAPPSSPAVDAETYAKIQQRWAARFDNEPALRAELAAGLARHAAATPKDLPLVDALVLPGQKLAHVSDFARICRAARRGEFGAALASAGVGRDTYANLCARFNARMQRDKLIEEQFQRMLEDPRVDAAG